MFFPRLLILTFLCLRLLGGDGGALQAVAWAGMLVTRAPEVGMAEAVESTFDGEHPCSLCSAIQQTEEPIEKEAPLPESLVLKLKLKDLAFSANMELPSPVAQDLIPATGFARVKDLASHRQDAPAVPPPQSGGRAS